MKSKMNIKSIFIMAIISLASMLFINISFAANTGVVNVEVANLRQEADAESTILEHIQLNEEVEILEEQGDWYKVTYKKITGYVSKELVTVNTQENVTTNTTENNINNEVENNTTNENTVNNNEVENSQTENNNQEENSLNIELGEYKIAEATNLKLIPSINATDVLELKVDETVNVVEIINGWVCIKTENATGWIRQEKLKKEEPKEETQQTEQPTTTVKTQYVSATSVNVRAEANTNSSIVTTITLNTAVEVSSEENGWSKVKVNNQEGYILSSLLSNTQTQTSRSLNTSRTSQTTNANANNNTNNNKETTTQTQTSTQNTSSSNGSAIVATAKKYLGYRYVYGGASPSTGFDCSGFTSYVYKQHGISLNRTAAGQYSNGVAVSRANLQPGDLVMFGKSGINHVAIYIGGGQIIHASTPSTGVRIDSLSTGYYNNNYVGARRII